MFLEKKNIIKIIKFLCIAIEITHVQEWTKLEIVRKIHSSIP